MQAEEDMSLITTEEVASIFNVHPATVIRWHSQKLLVGILPLNARRGGRRYKIAEVAKFAEIMGQKDGGYTPERFKEWYSSKSA